MQHRLRAKTYRLSAESHLRPVGWSNEGDSHVPVVGENLSDNVDHEQGSRQFLLVVKCQGGWAVLDVVVTAKKGTKRGVHWKE